MVVGEHGYLNGERNCCHTFSRAVCLAERAAAGEYFVVNQAGSSCSSDYRQAVMRSGHVDIYRRGWMRQIRPKA